MNNKQLVEEWLESWADVTGNVNSIQDILDWVFAIRQKTYVSIREYAMEKNDFWYYDEKNGKITYNIQ